MATQKFRAVLNDFAQTPPDRPVRIEVIEVGNDGRPVRTLVCPPAEESTLKKIAASNGRETWNEEDVAEYASELLGVTVEIHEPLADNPPAAEPRKPARRRR